MRISFLIIAGLVAGVATVCACDLCGCYTPDLEAMPGMQMTAAGGGPSWLAGSYAGIAQQFTHFGTDQFDGHEVPNPTGEYLNSSITQLIIGQTLPFFDNRLGLQVSVPFVDHDFRRPRGFAVEEGNIFGLGDVSLTANFIAWHTQSAAFDLPDKSVGGKNPIPIFHEPDFSAIVNLTVGIKLPTGDTGRLKENFHEINVPGAPESGIAGHDLTLGTGSVDGIFGAQALVRYKRAFLQADAQYTVRSKGDYAYQFANDLSWSGGAGVYLIRGKAGALGVQAVVSGDTKGYDEFNGEPDTDTGVTAFYVGPRIIVGSGRWNGEITGDLPVIMNTTQFQTAPSWRIRAGISFRF